MVSNVNLRPCVKAGAIPPLLGMLNPTNEANIKFAAVGCLQYLAYTEENRCELVRSIPHLAALLTEDHDRSKVCAASCLHTLAQSSAAGAEVQARPTFDFARFQKFTT